MDKHSDQSERSWDRMRYFSVVFLILVIAGIVLISAGVTDPKPLGRKAEIRKLSPVEVEPDEPLVSWLQYPTISEPFTIRLKAALQKGSPDAGYGLALGHDSDGVVIAVSPTGYLTIYRWHGVNQTGSPILPWQVWPHVGRSRELNEIWVDVEGGEITGIRINREILWEEAIPISGFDIGLFAQGFDGPATIDFQTLEYFSGG